MLEMFPPPIFNLFVLKTGTKEKASPISCSKAAENIYLVYDYTFISSIGMKTFHTH